MNPALWLPIAIITALLVGIAAVFGVMRATGGGRDGQNDGAAELIAAGLLPLVNCPRDRDACLRCIEVDNCVVHRLVELGLTPGTEVRVVQDSGGPMLLSVRGSRVMLGRDLAAKMWVELSG